LQTPPTAHDGAILARLDYRSLAMGYGVAYQEIRTPGRIGAPAEDGIRAQRPVLTRVVVDIAAVRCAGSPRLGSVRRRVDARTAPAVPSRIASRAVDPRPQND